MWVEPSPLNKLSRSTEPSRLSFVYVTICLVAVHYRRERWGVLLGQALAQLRECTHRQGLLQVRASPEVSFRLPDLFLNAYGGAAGAALVRPKSKFLVRSACPLSLSLSCARLHLSYSISAPGLLHC